MYRRAGKTSRAGADEQEKCLPAPQGFTGGENLKHLEQDGRYEKVKAGLDKHLEQLRGTISPDAYTQAKGDPPRRPEEIRARHSGMAREGRGDEPSNGYRPGVSQPDFKEAVVSDTTMNAELLQDDVPQEENRGRDKQQALQEPMEPMSGAPAPDELEEKKKELLNLEQFYYEIAPAAGARSVAARL